MNAPVLLDSVFSGAENTARAIAIMLGTQAIPIGDAGADQLGGIDLLAVGSPNREYSKTESLKNSLKDLPNCDLAGVSAAAFDARIKLETIDSRILCDVVDRGGYAVWTTARSLKKKVGRLIPQGGGSFVNGLQDLLKGGELELSADWIRKTKDRSPQGEQP